MRCWSIALAVFAFVGCGNKAEVPPAESFKCETAADCRVSCVERSDCCGDPCDCKTPYHRDELEQRRSGDAVLRTYGVGAQILRDLGLSKIRVLSAPKNMYAISGFDLEVVEYVSGEAGV